MRYLSTYSRRTSFPKNRHGNDNLEQQAQALFKSWFIDFEPFRDGNFIESELGLIPEGWRIGSIYEYVNVIYGAPYKSTLFNDQGKGLPLIRIRDLKTFNPQYSTVEKLANTEYVNTGDVVAGMDAEFSPCLWLGTEGVLNQRCCKFAPISHLISNYYVLYLLKPELEFVQSNKTGTTVSHLGKGDIDKFQVVIPPIRVVEDFSFVVNSVFCNKIRIANETRKLVAIRDSILPKIISGELKINDVNG